MTETGKIVRITSGMEKATLNNMTVNIIPYQAGSGDPSPTNIRAISGWTGANITRCGRNLFDGNGTSLDWSTNSQYIQVTSASVISALLKLPRDTDLFTDYVRTLDGTPQTRNAQMILRNGNTAVTVLTNLKTTIGNIPYGATFTNTRIYCTQGNMAGAKHIGDIRIGFSLDDVKKYEAYNGNYYTVDWTSDASTVYGGTFDCTTGLLTIDRLGVDIGSLSWTESQAVGHVVYRANLVGMKTSGVYDTGKLICSAYKTEQDGTTASPYNNYSIWALRNSAYVAVRDDSYPSADDFKTAMTGQTIVYPLKTPVTYQLSPITTDFIDGLNQIFCDCGTMTVDYTVDALITDRTFQDVQAVQNLNVLGISGMSASQLATYLSGMKGAYNASDLNRVGRACAWLYDLFTEMGYSVTGYTALKTDWAIGDIPTATQLTEYIGTVNALKAVLNTAQATPTSMDHIDYNDANNIEMLLSMIYEQITTAQAVSYRAGESWALSGNTMIYMR